MSTVLFGSIAYMITYSIMIYFNMVIIKQDRGWLKVYIPMSVIGYIIMIGYMMYKMGGV